MSAIAHLKRSIHAASLNDVQWYDGLPGHRVAQQLALAPPGLFPGCFREGLGDSGVLPDFTFCSGPEHCLL